MVTFRIKHGNHVDDGSRLPQMAQKSELDRVKADRDRYKTAYKQHQRQQNQSQAS